MTVFKTNDYAGLRFCIDHDQDFITNGRIRGYQGQTAPNGEGKLDAPWWDRHRINLNKIVYTVKSYDTPIAWKYQDGTWCVVDQKFSQTTSRHQGTVRRALALEPALNN